MTILGPKLVSSEGRDGFLGNTIDSIFWQVSGHFFKCDFSQLSIASTTDLLRSTRCFAKHECLCKHYWGPSCHVLCKTIPCCWRVLLSAKPCVGGGETTYCGWTAGEPNKATSYLCNTFGSILEFIFLEEKNIFLHESWVRNLEPVQMQPLFTVPWLWQRDAPSRARCARQVMSDQCFGG